MTRRELMAGLAGMAATTQEARRLAGLPRVEVRVDAGEGRGRLEVWRHTVGHGGINANPWPAGVRRGIALLKPRLVRIFIQEFFRVYPAHGRYDWSRLDPYLDAIASTGAKVVAALCIKPSPLYPKIDQRVWRPTDVREWQAVVAAMAHRYSVQKPIISRWEIGNETDIGEGGGTPHLIPDPEDYYAFYKMCIEPILRAAPAAKVGGPATTWAAAEPLPGFVQRCLRDGTKLDFVSWHRYDDNARNHAAGVEIVRKTLASYGVKRPEMMVTEWSKSFEPVSLEEAAFDPARAAIIANGLIAMIDAGLDWSFYYHAWDQVCHPADFAPFFSPGGVRNMVHHWNEAPHRFGLFGVGGEVRPQFFVYRMLGRMGSARVGAHTDEPSLALLAARSEGSVSALISHRADAGQDKVLDLHFAGLEPGPKLMRVYRIDATGRWQRSGLDLTPVEQREVDGGKELSVQVYAPASSVALVELAPRER